MWHIDATEIIIIGVYIKFWNWLLMGICNYNISTKMFNRIKVFKHPPGYGFNVLRLFLASEKDTTTCQWGTEIELLQEWN